jgi:hypothetical protein
VSKIVVFGAGGRAGRGAVTEAVSRGYQVVAVVRDPAKYLDLNGEGISVVKGDATDAASVAAVSAGADAAINAIFEADVPSEGLYVGAAKALISGLQEAAVDRLVLVGIGTTLQSEPGVMLHDIADFPEEIRTFSLGRAAELDYVRSAGGAIDWVVVAPPPVFLDEEAERTGDYQTAIDDLLPSPEDGPSTFSYADLAVALIDEIESPKHHHQLVAVGCPSDGTCW